MKSFPQQLLQSSQRALAPNYLLLLTTTHSTQIHTDQTKKLISNQNLKKKKALIYQNQKQKTTKKVHFREKKKEKKRKKRRTDGDVAVGALEHLVHAFGTKRGFEDASDGFSGGNVGLLSFESSQPRLLLLLFDDYEWPPELVESERHFWFHFTVLPDLSPKNAKQKSERERRSSEKNQGVFEKALTLSFFHFTVMPKTPYIRVWIWAGWFIYFGP